MILCDLSQVGLFWQEAPDKTNGILDCATFVTVERFAKVRACSKDFVGAHMLRILRPVVVSDREPKVYRETTESSGQSNAHSSCTFGFEFSHLCVSGLAFHGNLDSLVAFAAADGIRFPMADVKASENGLRAFFDGDPLWNMRFFMFPGVPSVFALAMGSHEEQNKRGGILVDPLINGFMTNGSFRVFDGQSPGDKFWRPSQTKAFFDIVSDKVVLESLSSMGFKSALIRSFLSFVSQVISGINRRGISFKFPGKGTWASLENRGDFP